MIQQGHKYKVHHIDAPLVAIRPLGSSGLWIMREIDGEWLGASHLVSPDYVGKLPMKYFHGQIPNGGA
jgi:hypothetical protein